MSPRRRSRSPTSRPCSRRSPPRLVIKVGLEDDAGAVETMRLAIERRGDTTEGDLSAWLAFEATDALTASSSASPIRRLCARVWSSSRRSADGSRPRALARGDLVQVEVRHALFGAAVEQLVGWGTHRCVGLRCRTPSPPGALAALPVLDREHRLFDAARIRLWLAEEGGGRAGPRLAAAIFEELGAHPYIERIRRFMA